MEFCLDAPRKPIIRYGRPETFNTNQGSQFTSPEFTGVLKEKMYRSAWMARAAGATTSFVERVWRSIKYEEVYLGSTTRFRCQGESGDLFQLLNPVGPASRLTGQTPRYDLLRGTAAEQDRGMNTTALPTASATYGPGSTGRRHRG